MLYIIIDAKSFIIASITKKSVYMVFFKFIFIYFLQFFFSKYQSPFLTKTHNEFNVRLMKVI